MNNNETKTLCLALVRADSEAEIISLLTDAGYWNEESAWRLYGDNDNNFSIIKQPRRGTGRKIRKLYRSSSNKSVPCSWDEPRGARSSTEHSRGGCQLLRGQSEAR